MDIHKFFDEQVITASKLPKERQRYTYYDLIAFAKVYATEVNKNCNKHDVSGMCEHPIKSLMFWNTGEVECSKCGYKTVPF